MKKLIIALSLAATFVASKSEAQTKSIAKSTEKGTKELVILHTNDTHSCIYPLNPQLADTLKAGRGGFLRRIAMLKEERKKNPDLLLFDSGDFSQGSPYYTLFKGDVEVGLMNKMHWWTLRTMKLCVTSTLSQLPMRWYRLLKTKRNATLLYVSRI